MAMLNASAKREGSDLHEDQAPSQAETDARLLSAIDRDRLIWDPEYRAEVRQALERLRRPTLA